MNARKITLIVAVVLAVGTGILTLRYLTSINQQAQAQAVVMKPVVIANRAIAARTKITPQMLTTTSRAASDVDPQALGDPKAAEGAIALVAIAQGTTLTSSTVGQPAQVGITFRLQPGMRAVSIPVDRVKDVSNLVQPGDRVDVMAAVSKGAGEPPKTFTIIRGALVLAINAQLDQGVASPAPAGDANSGTVTLGVTPVQADLLTVADLNTVLRLALRSPQEPIHSLPAEKLVFADLGNPSSGMPAPSNVPPPSRPAPAPLANVPVPAIVPAVTVIDGDRTISGAR